jgi:hypothetical protein
MARGPVQRAELLLAATPPSDGFLPKHLVEVYLSAEGRTMTPFEWATVSIAAISAATKVAQTIIQIIKKRREG